MPDCRYPCHLRRRPHLPTRPLTDQTYPSPVEAQDGTALDILTAPDGDDRLPATPSDVDQKFIALLIRTEDKRFYHHPGIDPLAMSRAVFQLIRSGHIVSGGSTITMQVARLLSPHPHSIAGKMFDIARALQLEAHFSKTQILAMYLTLAPYGGNIEGIRAASLIYFQKDPANLTPAEAALLVALPRAPERLRPDRHPDAALAATRLILARAGLPADISVADLPPLARHIPQIAPHLAARLRGMGETGIVITTLDANLQTQLTALAAREAPWLGQNANIAALIVDNHDHTILAYLGGAEFFGPHGMVDMVRAPRSPGSTLKPFIYGMALDDALITPDTLIQDAPLDIAGYAPKDFDGAFRGMVTARGALQNSYNLPAILLLRAIGPARFTAALRAAGATLDLPGNAAPSLPIALGGAGISLQDLAMLYTGLANGGAAAPLKFLPNQPDTAGAPEMSPAAAAQIGAILRGAPLPPRHRPHDPRDRLQNRHLLRVSRCLGRRVFAGLHGGRLDRPDGWHAAPRRLWPRHRRPAHVQMFWPAPAGFLWSSTRATSSGRRARRVQLPWRDPAFIKPRPQITFPPNGAVLQVTDGDNGTVPVSLEAQGGAPPYRWVINGQMLPKTPIGMSTAWLPAGPGFAHIAVIDKNDDAASEDVSLH